MNPKTYQQLAARTEAPTLQAREMLYRGNQADAHEPDLVPVRVNHAVIGMAGEVGEIADLIKRHIYHGRRIDRLAVAEEVGDLLWYAALLCTALDLDMGWIMEANIAKLKARYPEKYTDDMCHTTNRDTEAERKAMEAASGGPNVFKHKPFSSLHSSTHIPNPPSLKEVNEALGRRFLAEGADPATIDGEEDIHQVKKPEPGF